MNTRRGPLIASEWSQAALPPLAFIALFIGWQWSATALHIPVLDPAGTHRDRLDGL